MKFLKNITCSDCDIKCDIYKTLLSEPNVIDKVSPIHVFYKKRELICRQGAEVTHAIYLVKGSAKLYIEGLNNKNIALNLLKPDSYIGLLSFFESDNYNYSVKALEECQICMIDLQLIKKLYIENHDFLLKLNRAFGKSVAAIMKKIITLNQKNIRGRFADSLLYLSKFYNSNEFDLILTRKELGELSALSEENAVRLLSEFKGEGIISVNGKKIKIIDNKLLRKISEVG